MNAFSALHRESLTASIRDAAPTFLVFADDWGRHPSSCQHLVKRLLDQHNVIWVNTIGMRPPRLDRQTFRRGFGKIRQWLTPQKQSPAETAENSPQVLNPRMLPWMRRRWQRDLNDFLLLRQLRPVLNRVKGPIIGITTVPVAAGLIGHLPVERWIYYCVDDFSEWPGLEGGAIREQEDLLLERCHAVIAASSILKQRALSKGCNASLLTHGVDLDHWSSANEPAVTEIAVETGPEVLFFGLIDERMDREWLSVLDRTLGAGSITLRGPCQSAPVLGDYRRLRIAPAVEYASLPAKVAQADVLIMPYIDAPVTRAMQPLKLLEYLATGKPVVVRDLPANRGWSDCLDLASNAEDFARLVRLRLETGLPMSQRIARQRLQRECWNVKAEVFRNRILGLTA